LYGRAGIQSGATFGPAKRVINTSAWSSPSSIVWAPLCSSGFKVAI
jgi:hypothetical protein